MRTRGLEEKADSFLDSVSEECLKRQIERDPLTLPLKRVIWLLKNPVTLPPISVMLRTLLPQTQYVRGGWDNEHMGSYLREMERQG